MVIQTNYRANWYWRRRNFLTERVMKHCNELQREAVESPSLVAPSQCRGLGWQGSVQAEAGLDELRGLFQPESVKFQQTSLPSFLKCLQFRGTLERERGRGGGAPSLEAWAPQSFLCTLSERAAAEAVQRQQNSSDPARLTAGAAELHTCDMKANLETAFLWRPGRHYLVVLTAWEVTVPCQAHATKQPSWSRGAPFESQAGATLLLPTPKMHREHQDGLNWAVHTSEAA